MVRILSWDIGIKNLAYCILEQENKDMPIEILDWDIISLESNKNDIHNYHLNYLIKWMKSMN